VVEHSFLHSSYRSVLIIELLLDVESSSPGWILPGLRESDLHKGIQRKRCHE
jgi:hypothetical protein